MEHNKYKSAFCQQFCKKIKNTVFQILNKSNTYNLLFFETSYICMDNAKLSCFHIPIIITCKTYIIKFLIYKIIHVKLFKRYKEITYITFFLNYVNNYFAQKYYREIFRLYISYLYLLNHILVYFFFKHDSNELIIFIQNRNFSS